jgi:YVTN family beta-propeller protein
MIRRVPSFRTLSARMSLFVVLTSAALPVKVVSAEEHHYLYAVVPGIRNYLQYGGIGIVVFDMDHGYKFVKRIPTWSVPPGTDPLKSVENVKGVAASSKTGRLYVTTSGRLAAFDLVTDKKVWEKTFEGGCDRVAIAPDGKTLYVPLFEGPGWNVVDAATGNLITKIQTSTGSHNTVYAPDGSQVYMTSLHYNSMYIADTSTNKIIREVGPFGDAIRPFTVNGSNTRCYVNTNNLLGFQIGDLKTGEVLATVKTEGRQLGPTQRHGSPSHGIALTPDEKELWVTDGHNNYVDVYDATAMPPKHIGEVKTSDMPGWITLSIDGRYVIPSSGDVIDRKTRKIVYTLRDEAGQQLQTEKMVEVDFSNGKPIRNGDQFGIGQKR